MNGRRVVVTRRPVAVHRAARALGLDADDDADGADETRRLMARQARIALSTVAMVVALLVGLPLLTAPGDWLWVTLALQPVWVALAVIQLRRAERAERRP
ncbi:MULTISPECIES: hypothetical protein [Nonomuraea]|uniref:DUF3040 domain-containing protein n=1 Tax=Nonomuraea recticatena TaxID=46178 RepID=A0ABP6FNM0_9ACTN